MKICPKCNSGNKDNAVSCKDCGTTINNAKIVSKSQIINDYIKKEEKKKARKRIIQIASIVLIGLVYLLLYIRALSKGEFIPVTMIALLFPVIGYLNIFHPKFFFILKNIFTIENIDEVELTDFYLFASMITGIIMIVLGMVFMLMLTI